MTTAGVVIVDAHTHEERLQFSLQSVQAIAFSPKGTYLLTFQRPSKGEDGAASKNLKLWNVHNGGTEVLSMHQKILDRGHWPTVQFSSDESLALHAVTNTLHIYKTLSFDAGPCAKLPVKGLSVFSLGPSKLLVATYVPEAKGAPGHAAIYDISGLPESARVQSSPQPLCRKSFFRANDCRLIWSPSSSAVLALTSSDVDATNQSYYGEQHLYFLAANGTLESRVQLPKEGPVHDVQWNPKGDSFVALAGYMPAKAIIFDDKCVPIYDLGSGPYALARWNPFGRFLVLAGFGNLPGDMAFFDRKADGKVKPMGSTRAENGVTLSWSPDGRYVLAATIAPRLRVDNGFQVFKYNGIMVTKQAKQVLLEAVWVPSGEGGMKYEDRPQSPKTKDTLSPISAAPAPTKASGYVPPHLRNDPSAAARAAASFSLARDPNDKGGKIRVGSQSTAGMVPLNLPPGAQPLLPSGGLSKNAKKRANKNKKKTSSQNGDGAQS